MNHFFNISMPKTLDTLPETNYPGGFLSKHLPPYQVGNRAELYCKTQYTRPDHFISTVVLENGQLVWKPARIDCLPISPLTTLPETSVGGHFRCDHLPPYQHLQTATLVCQPGYDLPAHYYSKVKMKKSGQLYWEPSKIDCIPISCPKQKDVAHATVTNRFFHFPNRFHYVCERGYTLNRPDTEYTCTAKGQWEPAIPSDISCLPDCPVLGDPTHGTVSLPNRHFGAVATYRCHRDFILLEGDERRKCEVDGTWSGKEVVCGRVPCPEMPSTVNIVEKTLFFNRVACEDGQTITVFCQPNGQWASSYPYCDSRPKPKNTLLKTFKATFMSFGFIMILSLSILMIVVLIFGWKKRNG